jgi:hypothetical protein
VDLSGREVAGPNITMRAQVSGSLEWRPCATGGCSIRRGGTPEKDAADVGQPNTESRLGRLSETSLHIPTPAYCLHEASVLVGTCSAPEEQTGSSWPGAIDRSMVFCSRICTSERPDHFSVLCVLTKVQAHSRDTDTPADTEK